VVGLPKYAVDRCLRWLFSSTDNPLQENQLSGLQSLKSNFLSINHEVLGRKYLAEIIPLS
jgi:hypothetical protein